MNLSSLCRTCLSTADLNPIFNNIKLAEQYASDLYVVAGVKIHPNDGLPQNMCIQCVSYITDCIKFRKKCKDVENQLKFKLDCIYIKEETQVSIVKDNSYVDFVVKDKINENELLDNEENRPLIDIVSKYHNKITVPAVTNCDINTDNPIINKPGLILEDESDKGSKRVNCKFCNKNISKFSVYFHVNRYHPDADQRKIKCELCDTFILKSNIVKHKSNMHGTQPYQCRFCKSEYQTTEQLIQHVGTCTSKKRTRKASLTSRQLKECDVCHQLMQKGSLKKHKAIKHDGLGPVCEHCGLRLGNKLRLSEHRRAKHGYDKLKCSYCDFTSASNVALWNHERRHLGEKPFVCEACGAKFHAAYLLAQHKQSHRTEKLFKCEECGARFKANNSLHAHRAACQARQPRARFRCPLCARAFRCRRYAARHLRRLHRLPAPLPHIPPVSPVSPVLTGPTVSCELGECEL